MTVPLPIREENDDGLFWFLNENEKKSKELFQRYDFNSCSRIDILDSYYTGKGNSDVFIVPHKSRYQPCKKMRGSYGVTLPEVAVRDALLWSPSKPLSLGKHAPIESEIVEFHISDYTDSEEFYVSEDLLRDVVNSQADGEKRDALRNSEIRALVVEISERAIEAIGDIGYRWVQRRKGAGRIVSFANEGGLVWCDEELSKLLVYEFNISIVSAAEIFSRLFKELRAAIQTQSLQGDWGRLVADGEALTLIPAKSRL